MQATEAGATVRTGVEPLDERLGGLESGGSYLVTGAPGPAKLVAALQFVHAGIEDGEKSLLLTSGDAHGVLEIARAWGFELEAAWRARTLTILGFRDDFEMRAVRTVEPRSVLEELDRLAGDDLRRVAVDPGSLFLGTGTRSLLGRSFLSWARGIPATVCVTLSGEGPDARMAPSADWVLQAVTGRLIVSPRGPSLFQIALDENAPRKADRPEPVTVELRPGHGLIVPEQFPNRRREDRSGLDEDTILVVVLEDDFPTELANWARDAFTADVVHGAVEAVSWLDGGTPYGGVILYGGRERMDDAVQAARALRPLTDAALLFASDDQVRSSDRIQLLESGADDCLTGHLDFRELGVRLRQVMATRTRGGGATRGEDDDAARPAPELTGGRVDRSTFAEELERRTGTEDADVFGVVFLPAGNLPVARLEDLLASEVRDDDGDLVAPDSEGCLVLLQGAREGQVGAFLSRVEDRLGRALPRDGTGARWACHPSAPDRVRDLLEGRIGAGS